MGFDWIIYRLASSLLMLSTAVVGGMFVLWAWVDVVVSRWRTKNGWKIPTALYPFSILVVWDSTAFAYLGSAAVRQLPAQESEALCLFLVVASFVFLLAAAIIVRRNSGPGKRLVAVGSKILVVISIVCFVIMILGIPGLL